MKYLLQLALLSFVLSAYPAAAETLLIENARIHTLGEQGTIEGDLLVVDGRIDAIASDLDAPQTVLRIDAKGKPVTPGLFSAFSRLGLVEISAVSSTKDDVVDLPGVGPSVRIEAALNPYSEVWRQALVSGVTSAISAPSLGQTPFAGMSLAVRLGAHMVPVLESDVSLVIAMGQSGAELAGGSRAGNFNFIRQAFSDAEAHSMSGSWHAGYALGPHDLRALQEAKDARRLLSVHANRVSDIRAAIELSHALGMPLVILGGIEAWKMADELAAARVPVILYPFSNIPSSFESLGARIDNAVLLHAAGVEFAVMAPGTHESSQLRQLAGNLVAEGLPWEDGLKSITLSPARIWGFADQMGSLEVGKLADMVIWSGDPLEVTNWPEQVLVAGAPIDMRSRQDALYERYQSLSNVE